MNYGMASNEAKIKYNLTLNFMKKIWQKNSTQSVNSLIEDYTV
jgi:hypothetical protein